MESALAALCKTEKELRTGRKGEPWKVTVNLFDAYGTPGDTTDINVMYVDNARPYPGALVEIYGFATYGAFIHGDYSQYKNNIVMNNSDHGDVEKTHLDLFVAAHAADVGRSVKCKCR